MEKTPGTPTLPRKDSDQDFEEIRQAMTTSMSQDETERKARIEYLRSLTAGKQPQKGRFGVTLLKALAVLAAVAAVAGGVVWFFDKRTDDKQAAHAKTAQKETSNQTEQPQHVASKHYDSVAFALGFDYPENWKTSEASGKLTVASPTAQFKTASGTTTAQIVFTIQTKQPSLPGFKSGNGIATRTSEKVAYLKPTPNQRAQTYMTFVSNAGASTVGIDSVFVTGDLGYQKDQAVPQADIIQGDPLVSIFFAKCEGSTCAADPSTAKVTIADSAWSDSNAQVKAVKAMLTSLTIQ
jgi:hypothetical protein